MNSDKISLIIIDDDFSSRNTIKNVTVHGDSARFM
jgi:hypothetical protein